MSSFQPKMDLSAIKPYQGGLSRLDFAKNPIKLSSNEGALGASPKAVKAFHHAARSLSLYPEKDDRALREKLGSLHAIHPNQIILGAGSDELLQSLAHLALGKNDEGIFTRYGFCLYPNLIAIAGGRAGYSQ